MITQGKLYPGITSDEASVLKDFSIFYAIALFTLYFDMYSRISAKDGTDEQQFHYKMKEPEQFVFLDENAANKWWFEILIQIEQFYSGKVTSLYLMHFINILFISLFIGLI